MKMAVMDGIKSPTENSDSFSRDQGATRDTAST
jgi:hypothetical protein